MVNPPSVIIQVMPTINKTRFGILGYHQVLQLHNIVSKADYHVEVDSAIRPYSVGLQ